MRIPNTNNQKVCKIGELLPALYECDTHEHSDYSDKISDKININFHFIARVSHDTRATLVAKS